MKKNIIKTFFSSKKFSTKVAATFSSNIINLFLITLANIIIARQLGPKGKGIVSILTLVPFLLMTASHMGIGAANTYWGSKNKEHQQTLLGNSLVYALLLTISLTLPYFAFMPFYKPLLGGEIQNFFLLVCYWLFPLNLVWGYLNSLVQANQRIQELALGRILHNSIYLVLIFALLKIFHFSALAVIFSMLVAYIGENIWSIHILKKDLPFKLKIDLGLFRKQVVFGVKCYAATLFDFINFRFDMFLVNYFINIHQVGIYSISVMLANLVLYMSNAAGTTLFPFTAASEESEANHFTPLICRHILFWSILVSLLLSVIIKPLVTLLFTSSFIECVVPFFILLPGIILTSIKNLLANDLMGRGKPLPVTLANGLAAVLTIVFDFILIPLFGISGAAAASSIAYSLSAMLIIYQFLRETGVPLTRLLFPNSEDFLYYKTLFDKIND